MFRNFLKKKKGQNTAEYALLIALVIAGIIAMQQYAQRALQARVRDANVYMTSSTNKLGNSVQYEPYYQQSNYEVTRDSVENKRLAEGAEGISSDAVTNRVREGEQTTTYATGLSKPVTNQAMPSGI